MSNRQCWYNPVRVPSFEDESLVRERNGIPMSNATMTTSSEATMLRETQSRRDENGVESHDSVLDLIGHTPLLRLNHRLARGIKPAIYAKLEYLNPAGSVKDRIGLRMVEAAEEAGLLKKGGTIVEPTSGNTGVGLAMVAALKGYKTVFVMPDKMSQEKICPAQSLWGGGRHYADQRPPRIARQLLQRCGSARA